MMTLYYQAGQMLTKVLRLLSICLLFCAHVGAQPLHFQNYNTEHGLVQSQVTSLAQDRFNRLWIGTIGGLSVFDGTNFRNFTRAHGLKSQTILDIDLVHDGTAWIATAEGLSYYDGFRFHNYSLIQNPDSALVNTVQIDNRGRVWALAQNRLFLRAEDRFEEIQPAVNGDIIVTLSKDKAGVIHVAYLRSGVFKYEHDRWSQVLRAPKGFLFAMHCGRDGALYALSNEALVRMKNGEEMVLSRTVKDIDFRNTNVRMVLDAKGVLWITSIKGVWWFTNNQFELVQSEDGATDEQTLDVFVDNYSNVWLATNGSGMYKYSESPFSRFDNNFIPNARSIFGMYREGEMLVLASSLQGIYGFDVRKQSVKQLQFEAAPPVLTSFFHHDKLGTVATYFNQFFLWKKGKLRKRYVEEAKYSQIIWTAVGDTLWFVSNQGLHKFDGDTVKMVLRQGGLTAIGCSKQQQLVLGHLDGIMVFDPGTGKLEAVPQLKGLRMHCFASDDKQWYIGTDDRGLIIYDIQTQRLRSIDQASGLSCNFVYNLMLDRYQNLWAGTGCGIDRLQNIHERNIRIKSYGKSEGLNGAESNAHGSYEDQDGLIWFATTKGLFRYDRQLEREQLITPVVTLTGLKLFAKDVIARNLSDSVLPFSGLPYHPRFAHNQNSISFTFAAVCLSAPEKITFRYRLIGVDKDFIETKENTASYNQLAPGHYVFEVYASDENGEWHDNAYRYSFEVIAVFYQTLWFRLLATMLLLGLIAFVVYRYSRRKEAQRQKELKLREEEQDKVRQRTAEDFHDEIGNKITRINLLTMVAEKRVGDNKELRDLLIQIRHNTQSLYHGSKDIIWALQKESNYLKEALLRVQQNTIAMLHDTGIQLQIEEEPPIRENIHMPMDYGRNLILIFKEAVNNALKYSEANRLILRFYEDIDNSIVLELEDNGKGFDIDEQSEGNGLRNMRNRSRAIKGNFSLHSLPGIGTLVRIRLFSYSFEQ